ncbi:MAG: hypothetical protein V2A69_12075 [Pseudomonadota bacterium]
MRVVVLDGYTLNPGDLSWEKFQELGACPLLKANSCFITTHIAWASKAARSRFMEIAFGNPCAFLNGERKNIII